MVRTHTVALVIKAPPPVESRIHVGRYYVSMIGVAEK